AAAAGDAAAVADRGASAAGAPHRLRAALDRAPRGAAAAHGRALTAPLASAAGGGAPLARRARRRAAGSLDGHRTRARPCPTGWVLATVRADGLGCTASTSGAWG